MGMLNVFLYNNLIGTLTLLPGGQIFFSFEEHYIQDQKKETISQSFLSFHGEFIKNSQFYRTRLPPFFSNLLPEGPLRKYLAEKGGIQPFHEFGLLRLLGEDLAGAISVEVSDKNILKEEVVKNRKKEQGLKEEFHFSLAGVQLKFSALMDKKGGLTIPATGVGGDWIVKLPSFSFGNVPENEWTMMQLARKVGINVPDMKLVSISSISNLPELGTFKDKKAFAIKRFDRSEGHLKIHMEDFAQVYGVYPEDKYKKVSFTNISGMIWTLTGEKGLTEFIRRLVFTIMTGNGDMHLKNWSFIYPNKITPELSPAYDFVSTIPYLPLDNLALKLVRTKNMMECDENLFKDLCEKAKLPTYLVMQTVKETAQKTIETWKEEKSYFELPRRILDIIEKHMESIPLIR